MSQPRCTEGEDKNQKWVVEKAEHKRRVFGLEADSVLFDTSDYRNAPLGSVPRREKGPVSELQSEGT